MTYIGNVTGSFFRTPQGKVTAVEQDTAETLTDIANRYHPVLTHVKEGFASSFCSFFTVSEITLLFAFSLLPNLPPMDFM